MAAEQIQLDHPIYIVVREGVKKIFEKSFTEVPFTIGRSLTCDVPLPQFNWISRRHLEIYLEDGKVFARDLNSSNGITYKGQTYSNLEIKGNLTLEIGPLSVSFTVSPEQSKSVDDEATRRLTPVRDNTMTQTEYESSPRSFAPSNDRDEVPQAPAPKKAKISAQKIPAPSPSKPAVKKLVPPTAARPQGGRVVAARGTEPSLSYHATGSHHKASAPIMQAGSGMEALQLERLAPKIEKTAANRRVLETHITWQGQIYDSRLYYPGERVTIGTHHEDLYAPTLKGSYDVGQFDGEQADLLVNKGATGTFVAANKRTSTLEELLRAGALPKKGKGYLLTLTALDQCTIDLGHNLKLHVRYAPAPRQLSKSFLREPDKIMQKAVAYSGTVHIALVLLAFLLAPMHEIPKVKGLPPRVAKLLVQKKVEPPKKKEEPKPEPPKVVKEEPKPPKKVVEKKPIPPPKKVVVKSNEKLKVINKLPPAKVASERETPKPPEKNINELGALAALGALGTPTVNNPKNMPVAINVNPNAGGASSMSTTGVIGALKAKGGQLAAGGMPGVKTQGKGYGTGTGYGVQGLKGVAGSRGVAGAVIGSPKLMSISKNEGLSQKQVMEVVKGYIGKIQQCYERSLLTNPSLAGRVEYEWLISPQGGVKWVKVKRSDMSNSDTLNNCVMDIFKAMKFPVATNGESTTPAIGFPFGRL